MRENEKLPLVIMAFLAAIILLWFGIRGFLVSKDTPISAAVAKGYKNPRIVAEVLSFAKFHGCFENNAAKFTLEATESVTSTIQLTVCCGWPSKECGIKEETD